ncbi:RNA polymerase sigma factor [Stakelama sediminis]|uniref:RNA polymerase sigma-70 factor (ECF subfamily) n=1 Tax=Stakelama sediminis TaxID=463200 RepID=A0A840Z3F8_9SPHN|nr:RNA polymerase sigma-70 factor (ECF subfamily) [Stakelama sediminis]
MSTGYEERVHRNTDHDAVSGEGLTGLLSDHREELLRFVTARTGDPSLAEDLLQELWLRCHKASPVGVANARAYLFRMANNLILDWVKGERRSRSRDHGWAALRNRGWTADGDSIDPQAGPEEELIERQQEEQFAAAIAALPPGAGRAFRLHKIDGLPQAEVARQMGISRSGVEKHIAAAMARLRILLAGEEG